MRYDILRFNSGSSVRSLRHRLTSIEAEDPVVLVRRQGVSQVSWHRVSIPQLRETLESAEDDDVLSTHIQLDAANEVPAIEFDSVRGDDTVYGAVVRDGEVIAFCEGRIASALEGSSRGEAPAASAPPPPPTVRFPGTHARDDAVVGGEVESTFHAYPTIESPTTVTPEEEFEVSVGVSASPVRHTRSTGIEVTDLDPEEQTLTLGVLVSGPFAIALGSNNTGEIVVDRASFDHEPFTVRLIPCPPPDTYDPQSGVWTAEVVASFFYEGAFVGEGRRELRVNQMGTRSVTIESDASPPEAPRTQLVEADETIDLVFSITRVEPGAVGRFNVRLFSKHLPEPVDAGIIDLGIHPASFAVQLIREIGYTIANRVSDETLEAIARAIADLMPEGVEATLRRIWGQINPPDASDATLRAPDVLLLTDDWAVPWELMAIELDPARPGFLGCQVNLGRWPASKFDQLRPGPIAVRGLGVMVGHYNDARGVVPLPRAEEEGRDLEAAYVARVLNADADAFDQLLAGRLEDGFEFEGLHFAGHGESDPERGTYLMYSNGARMGTFAWGSAGVAAEKGAFLFVNACQVGTAEETLNQYGGLAGQAVNAGFRGFVAPLWSVSDDIARSISLGLYQASVEGSTVSSYLRDVRSNFRETDEEPAHTTYLAYVFYGHPGLQLGGPEARSE